MLVNETNNKKTQVPQYPVMIYNNDVYLASMFRIIVKTNIYIQ